jgi:hypothetical protein
VQLRIHDLRLSVRRIRRIGIFPIAKFGIVSAIVTNHDGVIPEDLLLSRHSSVRLFWPKCNDAAVEL